jgi:hypothetical protein
MEWNREIQHLSDGKFQSKDQHSPGDDGIGSSAWIDLSAKYQYVASVYEEFVKFAAEVAESANHLWQRSVRISVQF